MNLQSLRHLRGSERVLASTPDLALTFLLLLRKPLSSSGRLTFSLSSSCWSNSGPNPSTLHPQTAPKCPTTSIYTRRGGHGDLRGAIKSLKTAKPLKQLNKKVDILRPLTVNWWAVMLANTLADKVNGAESRRWGSLSPPYRIAETLAKAGVFSFLV